MTVSPDAPPAADAARAAVGDVEVYVLGAVDVEKERNRLRKQTDVLRKRVEGSRRKLANEDFLAKARPEVVEKEREKLRQAETELMALQRNLEALEPA
jgi:valyl-tRNA synthetase